MMADMSWTGQILLLVIGFPILYVALAKLIAPLVLWLNEKTVKFQPGKYDDPPKEYWERLAECMYKECKSYDTELWEKRATPEMKARLSRVPGHLQQRFIQETLRITPSNGKGLPHYYNYKGAVIPMYETTIKRKSPEYHAYIERYLETRGIVTTMVPPPYLPPFNLDDYQ